MTVPPGFVALTLATGCVCVIPKRVYVAGLKLGKQLRRWEAEAQRTATTERSDGDVAV